jgi:hypothetical protein
MRICCFSDIQFYLAFSLSASLCKPGLVHFQLRPNFSTKFTEGFYSFTKRKLNSMRNIYNLRDIWRYRRTFLRGLFGFVVNEILWIRDKFIGSEGWSLTVSRWVVAVLCHQDCGWLESGKDDRELVSREKCQVDWVRITWKVNQQNWKKSNKVRIWICFSLMKLFLICDAAFLKQCCSTCVRGENFWCVVCSKMKHSKAFGSCRIWF